MAMELSQAGFGTVKDVVSLPGGVNGFTSVVTPASKAVTIVTANGRLIKRNGSPVRVTSSVNDQITLNYSVDECDGETHKFLSIGARASYTVNQPAGDSTVLRINKVPTNPVGHCLYKIVAITYSLGLVSGKSVLQMSIWGRVLRSWQMRSRKPEASE